jgi:hypothetical protein
MEKIYSEKFCGVSKLTTNQRIAIKSAVLEIVSMKAEHANPF